jgi:hypothetical protein
MNHSRTGQKLLQNKTHFLKAMKDEENFGFAYLKSFFKIEF